MTERIKYKPDTLVELQEQLALKNHIDEYHWLADCYRWEEWAALFTEDMIFTHVASGQIVKGRKQALDLLRPPVVERFQRTQHVIVNLLFNLTGTHTAEGHGNLIFIGVEKSDAPHLNYKAGGFYQWEFVKTDRWRTSRTALEFIWDSKD